MKESEEIPQCLLLNSTGRPLNLLPLSSISWEHAIKQMVLGRITVLEWHEREVRSANWRTRVPSVAMIRSKTRKVFGVYFSKENVFLRDDFTCAYCGMKLQPRECTLDHVLPQSLGGETNYINTVTACGKCNSTKGQEMHEKWTPRYQPVMPTYWKLGANAIRNFQPPYPSWEPYLQV